MNGIETIRGKVIGLNSILSQGRTISCWTISMQTSTAPEPLDLSPYMGMFVEVTGDLHGDLWNARFVRVVEEQERREITGEVIGFNVIQGPDGPLECFEERPMYGWTLRLNLSEYMGRVVTVSGELHGDVLYGASIVAVAETIPGKDPEKEAKSLNDLLRIRQANRDRIEAVNGNLGTALGFKWTNGQRTDHPAVIIFVPQKAAPWLVPDEEMAPELLDGPGGLWCLTDVVTGGRPESEDELEPLPQLSAENERMVAELKSGRLGLIGGIQLAAFEDGIEDWDHAFVGTAGIAVRHKSTGKSGFLTNQHVADHLGRRIYHPWHYRFPIGYTDSLAEFSADENWYRGVIDESVSYVRCDCAFVQIDGSLAEYVRPGVHMLGETGPLLRIDPDTMDIIGQRVISVGRTRGMQRGTVAAFAYEFIDDVYSVYTDLLIIGEEGQAFSWQGDSGKIIVTDDEEHRPVALLWGGRQERLRHGKEQEKWSYAIDLGKVMDLLNLELFAG